MAVSQNDLLNGLESKVRFLMSRYEEMEKENSALEEALRKCEEERDLARVMERNWRGRYHDLLIARTISSSEEDTKKTLSRLSNLEREIDKCINMLLEDK
ncbi:MAG: hypothetical protein MJZ30_02110 [Paludibacteraceae bacterium]|nr:hypothetical protein [Paludibacteraceae bacterium]